MGRSRHLVFDELVKAAIARESAGAVSISRRRVVITVLRARGEMGSPEPWLQLGSATDPAEERLQVAPPFAPSSLRGRRDRRGTH